MKDLTELLSRKQEEEERKKTGIPAEQHKHDDGSIAIKFQICLPSTEENLFCFFCVRLCGCAVVKGSRDVVALLFSPYLFTSAHFFKH